MKKWLCALSICTMAGLGALGLGGCGANDEISAIRIKTLPSTTEFVVGDIITPALYDGVFTVEYKNGRKTDLHLNNADIVYIEYDDGTTSNQFNQAAENQVVVVRYKTMTTTFNVSVSRQNLDLEYTKNYEKTYTGETLSIDDILKLNLPQGVTVSKVEYREQSSDKTEAYDDTPVDAGTYDVRVTLDGGAKYNSLVLDDITYTIKKADISLALVDSDVSYNTIFMGYGDEVDAALNWQVGDGDLDIFTNALKSKYAELASYIQYAYRPLNKAEYTILAQTGNNVWLDSLPVGSYRLRAYAMGLPNFQDFYFETDLVVAAKELKYGVDYTLVIENDGQEVEYTLPASAMNVSTTIETSNPSDITVKVVMLNSRAERLLDNEPIIYFVSSNYDQANWQGEGATSANGYYDYKLVISASFRGDACYFDATFHAIKVVEPDSQA